MVIEWFILMLKMLRLSIITVSNPVYVLAPRLSFVFCRWGQEWVLTLYTRTKACFTESEFFQENDGDFFFPGMGEICEIQQIVASVPFWINYS